MLQVGDQYKWNGPDGYHWKNGSVYEVKRMYLKHLSETEYYDDCCAMSTDSRFDDIYTPLETSYALKVWERVQ